MTEVSAAHKLAEHIHDSFLGANGLLAPDEIKTSKVASRTGSTSSRTSQRIEVQGLVDNKIANQTLAKDISGMYHLSTTFQEYGGKHTPLNIYLDASLEAFDVIVGSVFIHKLVEIANARD